MNAVVSEIEELCGRNFDVSITGFDESLICNDSLDDLENIFEEKKHENNEAEEKDKKIKA